MNALEAAATVGFAAFLLFVILFVMFPQIRGDR